MPVLGFPLKEQEKDLLLVEGIRACCRKTIESYATHNPMMACLECGHLIKCFLNDVEFRNYIKFCLSRKRKIEVEQVAEFQIVVYRPYDSYCSKILHPLR